MSGIKHSPIVTWGRPLFFILYFLEFLQLLNLITLGETPPSMGSHARYQRLIELLSIFLWLKRATSIVTPMFLRTWGNGPHRVTTQLYVWSFKNRLLRDTRRNAFRVGCPNTPFSVLFFETAQQRSPVPCNTSSTKLGGIKSPRSMLSCDKRLPLDTRNLSGTAGKRFC